MNRLNLTWPFGLVAAGLCLGWGGGGCFGSHWGQSAARSRQAGFAPANAIADATDRCPQGALHRRRSQPSVDGVTERLLNEVQASARWHLEHSPRTGRRDCSGLVEQVLQRVGVAASGNSRTFFRDANTDARVLDAQFDPIAGMLAFFDHTYDANSNGRDDDELTHVAVVSEVLQDGTVVMVHRGSGRIKSLRMNLYAPGCHRGPDGAVLNDYLRSPRHGGGEGPRLAGELFHAFSLPPPGPDN